MHTAVLRGIDPIPVVVEVDVASGLPGFTLVGLPDSSVKEARERVFAAIKHAGFSIPPRRITINLAPADWRKEGSAFDLPMALALLAASGQVQIDALQDWIIAGELSLDGHLRAIRGALSLALHAQRENFRGILLPSVNAAEASLVESLRVLSAGHLRQAIQVLQNPSEAMRPPHATSPSGLAGREVYPDFRDLRGQFLARRALEVAAAGGHHFVFIGSPGCGKTMMARRVPGILPPMNQGEALEATCIYGCAGLLPKEGGLITQRPFRQPHHTASAHALVGGGPKLRPGEASLAHHGLLFLDEWPEFHRAALESLRQPLEDGYVQLSRVAGTVRFPSRFILGAAMNPCPCGYLFDSVKACTCSPEEIARYRRRISGPMLDRMDLHIEVPRLEMANLLRTDPGEATAALRGRVEKAREIQWERYRSQAGVECNARMGVQEIRKHAQLDGACRKLLVDAISRLGLSARAYDRILKVARTLADLEGVVDLREEHLAEAISYRSLDKSLAKMDSNSLTMTSSS